MPPQRPGGARVDSGNPGTKGLSELDGKLPNPERLRGGDQMDRASGLRGRTRRAYFVAQSALKIPVPESGSRLVR